MNPVLTCLCALPRVAQQSCTHTPINILTASPLHVRAPSTNLHESAMPCQYILFVHWECSSKSPELQLAWIIAAHQQQTQMKQTYHARATCSMKSVARTTSKTLFWHPNCPTHMRTYPRINAWRKATPNHTRAAKHETMSEMLGQKRKHSHLIHQ